MAVDSASPFDINIDPLTIDFDTNASIDIDTASTINIGIAAPTVIDTAPLETEVDIARSTVIDTAPRSIANLTPAATTIDPASSPAGAVLAMTRGFDMAFGSFNFHVDNDGVAELIFVSDSTLPATDPSASPAIEGNPSTTMPLTPSEEEPRLETATPSVGSNDFQDPPPSLNTAYCVECDAYHFVGAGDFSSHKIAGCEDPRGGTAAIYPMISECKRALNALTLRPTPYDPDYVEGLYSDYTCSDDDVYPEAKGKIGNSANSCSSKSATSDGGYVINYDSDIMIEVGSCIRDDNVYPLALGEISDDSIPPFGGYCMMASHGDGNEHRANNNRDRPNTGGRFITQDQIRHARRVYLGEAPLGPNPSPEELAALRFIIQEQKDQINADKRVLERRREDADASSRRRAELSSHYSSSVQHRARSHISPKGAARNIARNLEAEFNEVELLPRTKEAAIMVTAAYIAANASNGNEHMRHLRNLALEGVRVLQGTNEQDREAMPRRNIPPVEPSRHQAAAPAVVPRPQVVEPINGELRHGLAQNRVDSARVRRDARRFEEEAELEAFGNCRHGLCGTECFSFLIRSTLLPKGIELSDGVVKFNGQQDPRIWLDDFITAVTIRGGSRDNALQLLSLHLKDNARAWLNNHAPDSIRSWEEFRQAFISNFRGTSRRPTSFEELRLCVQKTRESLRSYISRWLSPRNTSENISPERAIDAFWDGLIR
jgi:hypothetical protein